MKYQFYGKYSSSPPYETDDEIVDLPSKFEVCWRCEGKGTHDCWEGGMTGDEMAEQSPDFFEDYRDGVYDTRCTVCSGQRVLEVVDRKQLSPEMLARYDKAEAEKVDYEAECEHERRMGY
jgi:hypothetical protein